MYTAYMGFYHHKNFETGDVTSGLTRAQLLEMARAGLIKREDYIRKDGHKTWHTADTVKGIDEILYLEHRTKILEGRHLGEMESMHYSHGSGTGGMGSVPPTGQKRKLFKQIKVATLYIMVVSVVVIVSLKIVNTSPNSTIAKETKTKVNNVLGVTAVESELIKDNVPVSAVPNRQLETTEVNDGEMPVEAANNPELQTQNDLESITRVANEIRYSYSRIFHWFGQFFSSYFERFIAQGRSVPAAIQQGPIVLNQAEQVYMVVELKGKFGVILRDSTGQYSNDFVTAYSLDAVLKRFSRNRKLQHIVFVMSSSGGDPSEIEKVRLVLEKYRNKLIYHGVIFQTAKVLDPIVGMFTHKYRSTNKSRYKIEEIGKHAGYPNWVEHKRSTRLAKSSVLNTIHKKMIKSIVYERELIDGMTQAFSTHLYTLSRMPELYKEARASHPNLFSYDKATSRYFDDRINQYVIYETGELSAAGKSSWNARMRSAASRWGSICSLINNVGNEFLSYEHKWDTIKKTKCMTPTQILQRSQLQKEYDDLIHQLGGELDSAVSRAPNPCVESGQIAELRNKFPVDPLPSRPNW